MILAENKSGGAIRKDVVVSIHQAASFNFFVLGKVTPVYVENVNPTLCFLREVFEAPKLVPGSFVIISVPSVP